MCAGVGSGGWRRRNVTKAATIRSSAADIATNRSVSAIGGRPWVQRSLSPRSATARFSTMMDAITPAQRTGIASTRSAGPTVSPIDANDQLRRSPGRIDPPASSVEPTDVNTRPAAPTASSHGVGRSSGATPTNRHIANPRIATRRRDPSKRASPNARSTSGVRNENAGRHASRTAARGARSATIPSRDAIAVGYRSSPSRRWVWPASGDGSVELRGTIATATTAPVSTPITSVANKAIHSGWALAEARRPANHSTHATVPRATHVRPSRRGVCAMPNSALSLAPTPPWTGRIVIGTGQFRLERGRGRSAGR